MFILGLAIAHVSGRDYDRTDTLQGNLPRSHIGVACPRLSANGLMFAPLVTSRLRLTALYRENPLVLPC
jgi:hypothetical protein